MPSASGAEAKSTTASFYHRGGRVSCPGYGRFDPDGLTVAARKSAGLACGDRIHVTNKRNGKSVDVRVTDRCPCRRGRDLDLSRGAARQLGMERSGVVPVTYIVLSPESGGEQLAEPKSPSAPSSEPLTFVQRFFGCRPWLNEQC